MPGIRDDYEYDADGDAKLAVPQPIFEQYEGKEIEQCRITGEIEAAVTRSIRSTIKPRMRWKVGAMMNDRVPDVTQLFAREPKMNLSEVDVEARIASYFMTFDRIVEDNGLSLMLGRGPAAGDEGKQPMKLRCKLLLANVTPEMLKVDLTRLIGLTHREAKVNDLALHDLMIDRATRQQRYYLMEAEMKQSAAPKSKDAP
ncbi:hypothetical protein PHMEG_00034212, partial [Phytophthora megakarya]